SAVEKLLVDQIIGNWLEMAYARCAAAQTGPAGQAFGIRQSLGNLRGWLLRPESLGVLGHKVPHARGPPSRDRLDVVRETIVMVGGVEARHGQQVLEDVVGQLAPADGRGPVQVSRKA